MVNAYVSLDKASELECCDYEVLKKKIQRNSNYYITKKVNNPSGGKEQILFSVSSLSKKARKLYKQQQKVEQTTASSSPIGDNDTAAGSPWYLSVDFNWYKEKHEKHYHNAIQMVEHIEHCLNYDGNCDKTEYIREYAQNIGVSLTSFYRKTRIYTEAIAWSAKISKENGKNFDYLKVLALCQKPKEPQGRIALTNEMKALIENIWFDPLFSANLCKYEKLYRKFREAAKEKGWAEEILPSDSTIRRYLNDIADETENARFLHERGEREFKRTKMVKTRRDLKMLKVMELVVADTHTFDCFVTVTDSNGNTRIVKPCLVGFMDMRSRALVGWGICEVPNSQIIKEVLISMIMEKKNENNPFFGVPRVLLIDNGKDYTCEYLTGRSRKERTVKVDLDTDTNGMYHEIGIEKDMRSLPYQAWTKGEIERFFGTVCEDFTKDFDSYVGTLTGSLTSAKVVKNIRELYSKGMLMTIEEFAARFEHWNLNVYSQRPHRGLKEQKEEFLTPLDVYKSAERYFKPAPPMKYLQEKAMIRIERKVYQTGIKLFDCYYMHEELNKYIGRNKKVIVGYDPKDVSKVFIYDIVTKKEICIAENVHLLNPLAPVGDKDLENHIRDQKRQIKNERATIALKRMTYEERIDAEKIQRNEKALVVPEIANSQKVVGMPKSKIQATKTESFDKDNRPEMNPFLARMAEEAFKTLDQRKVSG